ncbi:hypothetical protein J7355_14970 [Endozoicomonas sp. G2_2]|nr:hypothetical protein [Endozoicomonas sp. G2_2]MBO9471389.1 hypothetical protein [Endozoicomonas sp. G2_2]
MIREDQFTPGVALGYGGGRDDDGDLSAIDEVDARLLANAFASYKVGLLTFKGFVSQALTGDNEGQ